MDTWRSDTGEDDGEVIDLLSVDDYDAFKAKVYASLSWVLHKAFEDQVPHEFSNPFYERGERDWQIKPRLANLLANSELYCQACRNMFGENASQWQGHWSIIQVLSRKGIYAAGDVTETILMHTSPFKIKAHIALIDALMRAFSQEIITIERVTQSVRRFASFNASSELPSDLEDAILFWINKICVTVQLNIDKKLTGTGTSETIPKDPMTTPRDSICVPILENFMGDIGDGCSLAVLLNFYCPQIVKIEDIYLKSIVGIADSLYNFRLIRTFCDKYIPNKTCHFTYEDMLYTKEPLKENFLVMVAELFYWFEIKPLSVVTGGGGVSAPASGEGDGTRQAPSNVAQSAGKVPNVPISSITKQSFQRLKSDSELRSSSTQDIHKMSPSTPVQPRVPLLHKRHQQGHSSSHEDHTSQNHSKGVQRAHSLTSKDLKTSGVHQSVLAWQDKSHPEVSRSNEDVPPDTDRSGSNLLANVSIDSEMNGSFSSGSIDLGDLEPTPRTDRTDVTSSGDNKNTIHFSLQQQYHSQKQKTPFPDDLQVESVNSGTSDRHSRVSGMEEFEKGDHSSEIIEESDARGVNLHVEPLMPARLKPLKEKSNIHTKEEERGDEFPKKKVPSPPRLKRGVEFNPEVETISNSVELSRSDDTISDGQITPLPEDQMSPSAYNVSVPRVGNIFNEQRNNNFGINQQPKKFEAFFVRGSLGDSQATLTNRSNIIDDGVVKESFTISDEIHTPEAARAAGIPIIDSSDHHPFVRQVSREGSIASSRSSGDFSDHESRKIHFDHKTRESAETKHGQKQESSHSDISPGQYIFQKPVIVSRIKDSDKIAKTTATNFAEIKQMKQFGNVDNSGLIYMQHGQDGEEKKSPLKEVFKKNKTEKKTTFAPLPNQRTWQQSIATANQNQEQANTGTANGGTTSQELLKIKMKLEEKRKAIERKKHTQEIQQQKLRQKLGKAAFMHVIAKPKDEDELNEEDTPTGRPTTLQPSRMSVSDPQVQVEDRNAMNISDSSSRSTGSSVQSKVPSRPFSRDDIQQTIENVKKKWFNGDETVSARIREEEAIQLRAESPERTRSRRSLSVENRDITSLRNKSPGREQDDSENPETLEEYNSSLDKLNQSLTDLQGEIMKLSLKQKQAGQQPADSNEPVEKQTKDDTMNATTRSRSPPNNLEVKSRPEPVAERVPESGRLRGAQMRSSSEPRQIVQEQSQEEQIGNYQSHTLPRHPTYQQNQVPPFMMQGPVTVAGPAGPVYSNPNQFMPVNTGTGMVPTPQQYGSYLMGPTHPQQMGPIPPQQITPPYQHSPPHMYPPTAPMYPQPFAQQNIISPQTQPYPTMYHTQPQPQYQPHPHIASTYTTASHPQHPPYSQPMSVTQQPDSMSVPSSYPRVQDEVPVSNVTHDNQTVSQDSYVRRQIPSSKRESDNSKSDNSNVIETRTQDDDGFFIAMHESSPRRQKSPRTDTKTKTEPKVPSRTEKDQSIIVDNKQEIRSNIKEQSSLDSSVIADFAQKLTDKQPELDRSEMQSDTNQSQLDETDSSALDATGVGFVIGQDESMLDQSAEIEMQKKKDKILQMRLRRQEEQEIKRQKKEEEVQRKREMERLKQEESERRKSEEKARREQIFRNYLEKKEEDEEGGPPRKREEKPKQKPRPKSMFVKAGPGSNLNEGLENSASTEDLTSRAFTISAGSHNSTAYFLTPQPVRRNKSRSRGPRGKHIPSPSRTMRKAVSCNTLDQRQGAGGVGDSKNLAFGGLTHRRPPSPDLYKIRKGPRSNEGSDQGSVTGVPVGADYTGPKLFVKPSAKSNRHIIINAISHCCLAGSVNTDLKNKVLEEIAKSNAKHFMILFRDASCGYRGLYGFDPDSEDVTKLMGVGPRLITNKMIEKYYKYNSGAKSFSVVSSTKHVSVSIDAISLQNSVWKPAKAPAKGYK